MLIAVFVASGALLLASSQALALAASAPDSSSVPEWLQPKGSHLSAAELKPSGPSALLLPVSQVQPESPGGLRSAPISQVPPEAPALPSLAAEMGEDRGAAFFNGGTATLPPIAQAASPPTSQQIDERIQQLQQRLNTVGDVPLQQIYLGAPGTSSNTPTAFGGSWGSMGVGIGFQGRTRYTEESDGTAGAVVSFGNPQESVGLDVGVTILELYREGFGSRGSFNFKLHRTLPEDVAVAVGLENALVWGYSDADTSVYGVVSKRVRLKESSREPFSRLDLSLGLGTGRFRSEQEVQDGTGSVGVFGNVAVNVAEPVSVFAEWTGQDLNLGASIVPFRDLPLVITPALNDITGNAGDGVRFTLGVGYGFSFR